jgi:hypothetical protein
MRNKCTKTKPSINSRSSEPRRRKERSSNKQTQIAKQLGKEEPVNQLKFVDKKIAKSNLESNEKRLEKDEINAIEDINDENMILNSLLVDSNKDNMILQALKQEIQKEIINPNSNALRKGLSANPINYIYLFINLTNISLIAPKDRKCKREEEIINGDNQILIGTDYIYEELQWIYQSYTEHIMEHFTYGINELEHNQNINCNEYNRLHEKGFSDVEINWILGWIMDMKVQRPNELFTYEFHLKQYRNEEGCRRNLDNDVEIFKLLDEIMKDDDFILRLIAALKVNPLIERTSDEGIMEVVNRLKLFQELYGFIEKFEDELYIDQIYMMSDILSYLCLQMIFMNFKYAKSDKFVLGNNFYYKLDEKEIEERNKTDNTFEKIYKEEINKELKIEEEYFKIEHNETFSYIQTAVGFICSKLNAEISNEGGLRKLLAYIHLLHETYYKLIEIDRFNYIFKPYTIQSISKENSEKKELIQKDIKEQLKRRLKFDTLSVFDKIWEYYSCITPESIKTHKSEIQNEYYNLNNLNMSVIAQKYIRGGILILQDTLILTKEEFEYIQLTITAIAILADFIDKKEMNLLKEKLKELTSETSFIQHVIEQVSGYMCPRELWPVSKMNISNSNLLAFFTAVYLYLFKNRSQKEMDEYYETFKKEYQYLVNNIEITEPKRIIMSDTEKCIQNSLNMSMNTQNTTDNYTTNTIICNRIINSIKHNINEFYNGEEEEYQSMYRTVMANAIGMEYLMNKENLDNDKECNVCLGYCNDTCLYSSKSVNQKCPYFNINNDISMCIYCKNLTTTEHNLGYVEEYQDLNKKSGYIGNMKHTISTCGIFKNKIQRYVDNYIRSCIEAKKKIHILDCISSFILSIENGIIQFLIKQNNKIIRISWELVNAIYKYTTNYINSNLFNILNELKYNYDTKDVTIKPKNYTDIQNWVYYIAINLNNFDQKIMNKIKLYFGRTEDMNWRKWIDNQKDTWKYITETEINVYKFVNEEFIWIHQTEDKIFKFKMNDNQKLKMKLHETTRYIGNKRRNISNWNILGKTKNTIGSNTINQIDDLFIKSTSNINVNKRKLLSVSEMKELSDRRLKEFEEKDKILNDEYLKIQRDKDKMQEMEIEIQEKK